MPPKSWPPRGNLRTTARKTVPLRVPSQCTSLASPESPVAPPHPSTATARSKLGSSLSEDCLSISSDIKKNPKIENSSPSEKCSSPAIFNPQRQDEVKKIVTRTRKKVGAGDQVQEHAVFNLGSKGQILRGCSTQDTVLVSPKSPIAGGAGAELQGGDDGGSSTVPGTMVAADAGVEGKGRVGDEVLAMVDKAATEAGEPTKVGECRTRKVVKKTVRIVKKIVKRRVPKRAVTGSEGYEETKGVEIGGHTETERTELDLIEVEKVDSYGTVEKVDSDSTVEKLDSSGAAAHEETETLAKVDSYGTVEKVDCDGTVEKFDSNGAVGNEETETVANVDIVKERDESLEPATDELNLIEVAAADHSGTVSLETEENSKPNCNVTLEIENEGLKETKGQAEEITKRNLSAESIVKREDVEELRDSTSGSSSQHLVAGENDGNESLMVEDQLENGNKGPIQERRQDGEKNDVGLNAALTLSGEMEALERRKRRRTEIFVGGLDKDTKEEDIRKLFEPLGEVTQVRLVKNGDSGKNKGFAFLRFASAADAKKALEKFSTVEICGKQCGVRPVEGNDTIYLGNINRKWKSEDVVHQLKLAKIQNIDKVIVMTNPYNLEQNRGFAFLEFQTSKDAQIAFTRLQKYDVFINQMKIKVAWAQPLVEPDEEQMLKVKSVYVEYVPLSWDEAKVRNFFKRFGEIEGITLAKNLPSSRRKDIAFVNYTTRKAALTCIEVLAHEQVDDTGSKVKVKVSLAKPLTKVKQTKQVSSTIGKEHVKEKRVASKVVLKAHEHFKHEKHTSNSVEGIGVDRTSSTTDELLQLLRQQARLGQPRPGSSDQNYHYASAGIKRPFSALGSHPLFLEPRGFPYSYPETSHIYGSTSVYSSPVDMVSLPNSQRQRMGYTHESPLGFEKDRHFKQTREQAAYFGRGGMYHNS